MIDIIDSSETDNKVQDSIYKQLLDLNPEAFVVHLDGNIIYANPAALKFYGAGEDFDYKNTRIEQLLTHDSLSSALDRINRISNNNSNESGTIKVKTFDGKVKTVEVNSKAINYNDKTAILVIIRDVSELIEAHEKIKSSEILFKAIFEASSNSVILTQIEDGKIIEVNKSLVELSGYSKEDLVGRTTKEMSFWPNDDDRIKLIKEVSNLGKADNLELQFRVKSGKLITIKVNIRIVEIFNNKYLLTIIEDITERKLAEEKIKESEARFRLIAENTSDALMVINSNFEMVYVSPAYSKQYILDDKFILPFSKEQIYGLIHPDDIDKVIPKVFEAIYNHQSNLRYIYRARYGNNNYMWREDNASFIYDENNNFKIAYLVSRDITDKIKQDEDLQFAKEKAEESDKLKTAFLQNMSHEIRTPLNGILGFSRLLESEDLQKEEISEFIGLIKQSSYRLLDTMNNILELSQIETGQIALIHKPIFINSLISDLFDEYYDKAVSKNLKFTYNMALEDENSYVQSDSKRLYQILSNLLSNAIKFTIEGQIELGYYIENFDIVFYVKDTGLGIRPDHIERIFDRFFQSELSISRNYEGNGLGLTISKELVRLLGGKIKVESEFGKGSKFYISLPIS